MTAANGTSSGKLRLDLDELTFEELAEMAEKVGVGLEAFQGPAAFRLMAGLAWIVKRRDDPTYTYEQALKLRMGDVEMIGTPGPEAFGGAGGATPPESLEPGTSTLSP
jgi:hypothetical protein